MKKSGFFFRKKPRKMALFPEKKPAILSWNPEKRGGFPGDFPEIPKIPEIPEKSVPEISEIFKFRSKFLPKIHRYVRETPKRPPGIFGVFRIFFRKDNKNLCTPPKNPQKLTFENFAIFLHVMAHNQSFYPQKTRFFDRKFGQLFFNFPTPS